MKRHSVVEPVSKSRSNDQELLEETSDTPSNGRRAVFSHVDWRNTGHATNTETSDEASSVHLTDMVKRGDLNNSS